jgi:Tfp pilus assembly protein PilF
MRLRLPLAAAAIVTLALAFLLLQAAGPDPALEDRLARHRNLGKAFYENPTTQNDAVEEFRKAFQLAPNSARERLNYGLALLRAGKTPEGVAELEKVQKTDPKIPHTWFNLGIVFKKNGEQDRAVQQFQRMVELVPDEPISHYNLGALYKIAGRMDDAIQQFQTAAKLDTLLAAPHFQLYNAYRTTARPDEAKRELETFQRLKKQAEGSATPEDVEWSAYAEVYDVMADRAPSQPLTEPKFQDRKLAGRASGVISFDLNGDGKPRLLLWSDDGLRLEPGGPVAALKGIISVSAADFNNDGLPDLCVLTEAGPLLFTNNKGKLEKHNAALPARRFEKAIWLDYDHDYDLDLLLLGKQPVLLRNQGPAGFEDHTADFPFVHAEAIDAAVFRAVADTKGMDLAVSYRDHDGVLYRDRLAGKYDALPLPLKPGATSLAAADMNNDGHIDLLSVSGGEVQLTRNLNGVFQPPQVVRKADAFSVADVQNRGTLDVITSPLPPCTSSVALDSDNDGRIDIACVSAGEAHLYINQTETKNEWIRVRLAGVKNLKTAPYSEIEVKAGPRYQKRIYTGEPLLIGIGGEKLVDTVRITWPNGLIQNEMKQPARKQARYEEAQRLSGSCPNIWTWNGREFEYITDVLGVAPLGASSGDGKYFPVDHDEYIQISGKSLQPVDGKYDIRITEELSEVAYLDHVRLIAVDHPARLSVYTNEKFQGPPFPEFRLFGVERRIYPKTARDDQGHDVLSKVLAKDQAYPDAFPRTLAGVASEHSLSLDFGAAGSHVDHPVLILSGWVDWADGSTFMSSAQEAKGGLVPPYLQMKDSRGNWKTVIEDMGMPAGKPKTIAVDLTGKWISASREVRIVTNLCVYWDEIFLGEDTGASAAAPTMVPSLTASLRFRGFSANRVHPERKQPEVFTYANPFPVSMWNPTPGNYTRYGDVKELLDTVDDRLVVMGSGDELRLQFAASQLPPLCTSCTRDFLLLVDGWAKDRDANTAYSQSTEPLPFHAMSQFPYPPVEHYPDDPAHNEYRRKYNTRPGLRLIRPLRP